MKLSTLAHTYDQIAQAGSDSRRIRILADFFQGLNKPTLEAAAHFTMGEVVDPQKTDRLGIGPGTLRAALAQLSSKEPGEIEDEVKKTGDMSEVAAQLVNGTDTLTAAALWQRANRAIERNEDRQQLLVYIFTHTTANGAKYFVRMVLNQMRIGIGFGALTRAIAAAFAVDVEALEHLYAMSNDIGLVATRARQGPASLVHTGLALFRPYQFMTAHKVDDPKDIFHRLVGKKIIFEVKYDGARLQIHIKDGRPAEIKLYSRRLNDDTESLPDVVGALRKAWKGGDAIVEGETVAYDRGLQEKQPFQAVLMRLGRKYEVEKTAREVPLVLYLFDLLYLAGKDLMGVPQKERRAQLNTLFRSTDRVKQTDARVSHRLEDEKKFFTQAIQAGHEGLVAKDPDAPYVPGKRTEYWMKLKPAFETLDVVVVGGIWGSGRRRGMLSSLVVAVRDEDEFKTVGKVGTGFSEQVLKELTAKLEPLIVTTWGRNVEIEPSAVIEVDFQGMQKTTAYTSGYALRIPRFKRERTDKSIRDADTLERVKRLYRQ